MDSLMCGDWRALQRASHSTLSCHFPNNLLKRNSSCLPSQLGPGVARRRFLCLTGCSLCVGNVPHQGLVLSKHRTGGRKLVPGAGNPSWSSGATQPVLGDNCSQHTSNMDWCPRLGNRRNQEAVNIFLKAPYS